VGLELPILAPIARIGQDLGAPSVCPLMRALRSPGNDGRRLFARRYLESLGFDVATAAGADADRVVCLPQSPFLL
jgi:hypothetical protein